MSIAAAMIGEGYTITAADTRVTNTLKGEYRDNATKLFKTDFGWVANSGGVSLHTTFFNNLLAMAGTETRKDIYGMANSYEDA